MEELLGQVCDVPERNFKIWGLLSEERLSRAMISMRQGTRLLLPQLFNLQRKEKRNS